MGNVLEYRAREGSSVASGGEVIDLVALRERARIRAPHLMQDVATLAALCVDRPEVLLGMLEAGQRLSARSR